MPKTATITSGIAVQMISSSVLPCVGSPSRRSEGPRWRNFHSEYPIATITTVKITNEMYVIAMKSGNWFFDCCEPSTGNQLTPR